MSQQEIDELEREKNSAEVERNKKRNKLQEERQVQHLDKLPREAYMDAKEHAMLAFKEKYGEFGGLSVRITVFNYTASSINSNVLNWESRVISKA